MRNSVPSAIHSPSQELGVAVCAVAELRVPSKKLVAISKAKVKEEFVSLLFGFDCINFLICG